MSFYAEMQKLFPQVTQQVRGQRLIYLDSAATALKPISVIEAVRQDMSFHSANVHRGAHYLADKGTERYEGVRQKVADFVGADLASEIIFTRGTTESLNLAAFSLSEELLKADDVILVSQMEHHSNIVPWQLAAQRHGAQVQFIPVTEKGELDFVAFKQMLSSKVKIVSLVHLSNALGTLNPVSDFFVEAKKVGAVCVLDAAQSVAAMKLDVSELQCDFLAFSGHKLFGPNGVGVLYGKQEWLERIPPYQGGGSMIADVSESGVSFLPPPQKFEAGTPPISQVVGLGAAIDFVKGIGFKEIHTHEQKLLYTLSEELNKWPEINRLGTPSPHTNIFSFTYSNHHPSDVAAILDEQNIAVRAGHHCCQPLMKRLNIVGTVRASFSIYNSEEDVQGLITGLKKAKELLG